MKLTIDQEFKEYIEPLLPEELALLEMSLKEDGCRDPIVTWNGTIVDGHNRYEICKANGIEFHTVAKEFEDRLAALEWIIRNQFGRRNLSPYQRTKHALRLEETIKARAKANMLSTQNNNAAKQKSAELTPIETREELAKLANVSRDTVDKVKQIERKATPEIKASLAKGEISINKAHQTVKTPKNQDEIEPLVVDGTDDGEPLKRARVPKWIPDDADRLWLLAKQDLNKILKDDKSRERVLREIIKYAQDRIDNNK